MTIKTAIESLIESGLIIAPQKVQADYEEQNLWLKKELETAKQSGARHIMASNGDVRACLYSQQSWNARNELTGLDYYGEKNSI